MDKPNISPDFTIDDIHKLREHNYNTTKDMTIDERNAYYKSKAEKIRTELETRKKEKQLVTH